MLNIKFNTIIEPSEQILRSSHATAQWLKSMPEALTFTQVWNKLASRKAFSVCYVDFSSWAGKLEKPRDPNLRRDIYLKTLNALSEALAQHPSNNLMLLGTAWLHQWPSKLIAPWNDHHVHDAYEDLRQQLHCSSEIEVHPTKECPAPSVVEWSSFCIVPAKFLNFVWTETVTHYLNSHQQSMLLAYMHGRCNSYTKSDSYLKTLRSLTYQHLDEYPEQRELFVTALYISAGPLSLDRKLESMDTIQNRYLELQETIIAAHEYSNFANMIACGVKDWPPPEKIPALLPSPEILILAHEVGSINGGGANLLSWFFQNANPMHVNNIDELYRHYSEM